MAFSFDVNAAATTSTGSITYRLKQLLVSVGWTVLSSGTGTSGTYSSNSDLITTTTLDTARAWFVIKHPTMPLQICFQAVATSSARIKTSANAGFIGGSPNANTVPSATDEHVMHGTGTDASPGGGALMPGGSMRGNIIVGDADEAYSFVMWTNANGVSGANAMFWMDGIKPAAKSTTDDYGYVFGASGSTSNIFTYGSSLAFDCDSPFIIDSSGAISWEQPYPMCFLCAGVLSIPGSMGTDVITGGDLLFPMAWCRYGTTGSSFNGPGGWKGFSTIFHMLGTLRAYGDTISTDGTKDHVVVGSTSSPTSCSMALPWNGTDLTI